MTRLLTYIGALAAWALAVVALAQLGEVIREATPIVMHAPLSGAGAAIVTGASLSLLIFKSPPFSMSVLAWRASMFAGMAVGFLMFCFYVSGAECTHSGRSFSCGLVDFK